MAAGALRQAPAAPGKILPLSFFIPDNPFLNHLPFWAIIKNHFRFLGGPNLSEMIVRPFQEKDRDRVRQIAGDTANRGRPVETFFRGRSVMEDLLTDYYIQDEPQSLLVAECDGLVVGYLTGCFDQANFQKRMAWRVVPETFWRALWQGVFLRRETWRMLYNGYRTLLSGGFDKRIPIKEYPVHLHINVDSRYRHQQAGRHLMEKFFTMVRRRNLPGIHAVVRADNAAGRQFFEKMGFVQLSRHPLIWPEGEKDRQRYTLVYGKRL